MIGWKRFESNFDLIGLQDDFIIAVHSYDDFCHDSDSEITVWCVCVAGFDISAVRGDATASPANIFAIAQEKSFLS